MRLYPKSLLAILIACSTLAGCGGGSDDSMQLKTGTTPGMPHLLFAAR